MQLLLAPLVTFLRGFFLNLFSSFGTKLFAGFLFIAEPLFRTIKNWLTKMPLYLAWFALAYILLSGLMLLFDALISGLIPVIPASVETASGWFLPSNTFECMTAVITSKIYRFAYDHKTAAAKNKLVVTSS